MLVALGLRLWDLGGRPVHYDESLHAQYSWQLFSGDGYRYEPWIHGPLQFFLNSIVFAIFWDSDFTVRIIYTLFGAGLVALPYFLRSYLGRWSAIIASVMLALSPALLYFSRYSRNDILMVFWSLALFVLFWRYSYENKNRYLYLAAAVLALAFATKETAYIMVAIFGLFLVVSTRAELVGVALGRISLSALKGHAGFLVLIITLTLPQWAALSSVFQVFGSHGLVLAYSGDEAVNPVGLPLWGEPFVNLAIIDLPGWAHALIVGEILTVGLWGISRTRKRAKYALIIFSVMAVVVLAYTIAALADVEIARNYLIAGTILVVMSILAAMVGLIWRWKVWLVSASVFYLIWTALYTSFYGLLMRPYTECPSTLQGLVYITCAKFGGVFTGAWQGLGYWLAQQDVARGGQPWYYYFVLGSVYEFLPFLFGGIAVVYYLKKGGSLGLFLVFWSLCTLFIYTVASEKMPWLMVNITVPFILLSAKFAGDLIENLPWRRLLPSFNLMLLMVAPLFLIAYIYLLQQLLSAEGLTSWSTGVGLVTVSLLGVLLITLIYRTWPSVGLSLATLGVGLMLVGFTAFVGFRATYNNGEEPIEMLVYAGASADVRQLATDLRRAADHMDPTKKIHVDYEIWYPLNWYLRNDNFVEYRCYKEPHEPGYVGWCRSIDKTPSVSHLVLLDSHGHRDSSQLESYDRHGPYRDLIWFPEGYRRKGENRKTEAFWNEILMDFGFLKDNIGHKQSWSDALDYLIYRKIGSQWLDSRFFTYIYNEA